MPGITSYAQLAAGFKKEIVVASVLGVAGGVAWKTYHWGHLREVSRMNRHREAVKQAAREAYVKSE
eukprot:CAMPEP_0203806468 /NCGR_PEP_ID=MMETSP0115-20131106/501_1 /ASSEMBLY_ACC=CAM_ASM_000227 /TAXON_ID=33651 /ORGANISM="Bicosoecid sp, Strain ms1" /LENGTH=65 /DNA_ID=CAMNT_0050715127 /DNA_START=26 /DNA_END=223 /DNA_ORIENTATION=-